MSDQLTKILITGASGFLGTSLGKALSLAGCYSLKAQVRKSIEVPWAEEVILLPDLSHIEPLNNIFDEVDVIIHCAARVHVMDDTSSNPLADFRKINVEGSINLANMAAKSGVRRFIFISSIKVNGENTEGGRVYDEDDTPSPKDPYGVSKMEAEEGLKRIAAETGMELVIIRPVLVYGPGVKANFFSMMRWVDKEIPLPLGAIRNKRSLIAIDNLIDLIETCIHHPAAANQTFLASDGEDLSTTDLLKRIGVALDRKTRLIRIPYIIISILLVTIGKKSIAERLGESLQVDISKSRDLLNWTPPLSVDEGLKITAKWYLESE